MANLDKDIVITPNKEQTADPSIAFSGANATVGPQTIYANVYPLNGGTISFEGSAGQLFSITNTLSGTIFSVNDVSGIPSIEVLDTGVVRLAQYNGNVGIGTSTAQSGFKLQVTGNTAVTGRVGIGTSNIIGVSNALVVYGSIMAYGNLDLANPAGGTSGIYFNDGTYQTTAAGTVQNSSGIAGTVQYSGGSGTFAGDAASFFWDSANKRLGIGTASPSNSLSVYGATPAFFPTANGAGVFEIAIGNTTATSTTVGYSAASVPLAFGYISATASSVKNITFNSGGYTGIGGITQPKNTLDVGGGMVVGATYAGSAIYTAPTNGIAVQGTVGIGTSTPQASSILSVAAPSVPKINLQVGAVERAYLQYDESASLVTLDSDAALRFNTNNTERMRIDATGKVGFGGITAPDTSIEMAGTFRIQGAYNDKAYYTTFTQAYPGNFTASIKTNAYADSTFLTAVPGATPYTLLPHGNIGIGTTAPGVKLDINGSARLTTGSYLYWFNYNSTTNGPSITGSNDSLNLEAGPTGSGRGALNLTGHNNTTLQTDAGYLSLSASQASTSEAHIKFSTASSERMRIDHTGNVGVGSTLSVAGSTLVNTLTANSTIQSTSTTTGAVVVGGGIGAAGNINIGGYIQMPQMRMYSFTRTIPVVVNDVVDLGSATLSNGGGMFEISIVAPNSSFSVSKYYILPINYSETASAWTVAQPISDGGSYSGNDFDLDINVGTGTASFRIRRTAGSTVGTAYVTIKQSGISLAFVESTATATVTAPTGFYNAAVLRQVDGRVGIGTAAPLSTLDVNGIATLRSTALVNTTTTGTNGVLQVAGSIGLQGSTQIRQATNSDGSTLQLLATSVIVGSTNGTSYNYAGGGLLASLSASDGAVLLDTGRPTSTDARVKVVNTTSSNAYFSVEKNGVYTLYASTAGQIGINTSSPGSVLDVNGISSFRSAVSVAGATAVASLNVNAGTYTNTLNVNTTANVNALTSNTGITVSAGGITVTGLSTFTGNVGINGNLTVTGTINTQNANVLVVNDPIIYLGEGNTSNLWDLGIIANYNDGVYEHTGFVRNRQDGIWTLFDNMTSEPNVSTGNINWADSTLTFAPMKLGNLTVVGNTRSTTSSTGAIVLSGLGGIGVGGNIYVGGQQSGITGNLWIAGSNASTTSATGALVVTNGVGIGGALNVGSTISTGTAATATAASHYWVQTGSDNVIRPKTLANVQNEIVTFSAVSAAMNSYSVKTANYTAVNNDRLLCDTSGGTFTITLPATPTLGTNITIYDRANFTAIPLTVARNGSTIEGLADDFSLDIGQTRNEIVYDGVTWHIYVSIGPRGLSGSNTAPSSSVAYSIALG